MPLGTFTDSGAKTSVITRYAAQNGRATSAPRASTPQRNRPVTELSHRPRWPKNARCRTMLSGMAATFDRLTDSSSAGVRSSRMASTSSSVVAPR